MTTPSTLKPLFRSGGASPGQTGADAASPIEFVLVALLFLSATLGQDRIQGYLLAQYQVEARLLQDTWQELAALEASLFLIALLTLAVPLRRQLAELLGLWNRASLLQSAAFMLGLYCLAGQLLPASLGLDYQHMTMQPFDQPNNWINRRLLTPALAYYLHLNVWLYPVLVTLLSWLSIALVLGVLERLQPGRISLLEKFALCTCSFAIYQFQLPGYPDTLTLILGLLLWQGNLDARGQRLLVTLMLLNHEALALFTVLPLLPLLRKPGWIVALFALYGAGYAFNFGFDPAAALAKQSVLADTSQGSLGALRDFLAHPGHVLLAILVAYKLAWLSLARGAAAAWQAGRRGDVWLIAAGIALPLSQTVIATDASRLAGMGFMATLLGYAWFAGAMPAKTRRLWALGQLAIPSIYVASDVGPVYGSGLYGAWAQWLGALGGG